jgi:hypothetical protein
MPAVYRYAVATTRDCLADRVHNLKKWADDFVTCWSSVIFTMGLLELAMDCDARSVMDGPEADRATNSPDWGGEFGRNCSQAHITGHKSVCYKFNAAPPRFLMISVPFQSSLGDCTI